jgi:hypothetical protein
VGWKSHTVPFHGGLQVGGSAPPINSFKKNIKFTKISYKFVKLN